MLLIDKQNAEHPNIIKFAAMIDNVQWKNFKEVLSRIFEQAYMWVQKS